MSGIGLKHSGVLGQECLRRKQCFAATQNPKGLGSTGTELHPAEGTACASAAGPDHPKTCIQVRLWRNSSSHVCRSPESSLQRFQSLRSPAQAPESLLARLSLSDTPALLGVWGALRLA